MGASCVIKAKFDLKSQFALQRFSVVYGLENGGSI